MTGWNADDAPVFLDTALGPVSRRAVGQPLTTGYRHLNVSGVDTPEPPSRWTAERQREYNREYSQRPENKARRVERCKRPENLAKVRERDRKYSKSPKAKARDRERARRPEVRAMKREYGRRPEIKARAALRYRRQKLQRGAMTPAEVKAEGLRRRQGLLRKYGMTLEQYEAMLAAQGGGCALCGKRPEHYRKSLHVDHEHETGRVRGILCAGCNTLLGRLGQCGRDFLEKMLQYLVSGGAR